MCNFCAAEPQIKSSLCSPSSKFERESVTFWSWLTVKCEFFNWISQYSCGNRFLQEPTAFGHLSQNPGTTPPGSGNDIFWMQVLGMF